MFGFMLRARYRPAGLRAILALGLSLALGCATDDLTIDEASDDLTSSTALARQLKFAGLVYVSPTAGDSEILQAVRKQTQSAFGALREATVAVNSRELSEVDAKSFTKTLMDVVDPATSKVLKQVQRVTYTYTDTAVMPKSFAKRSSLSLGLLHGDIAGKTQQILKECTTNDKHAQEFAGSVWYVFNPSLTSCKKAMAAEQKLIDAERVKLTAPVKQVTLAEVNRLYVPMSAALLGNLTNKGASWPEYDRLWSQGVNSGRLTIASVNGMLADWHAGSAMELVDDEGWGEWMQQLRALFSARGGWKLVSVEGLSKPLDFAVGGKTISVASFDDILAMELDNTKWPAGIGTSQEQRALRVAMGKQLYQRWLRFERALTVKVGTAAAKPVTLTFDTYFGAGSSPVPHKRAIKSADVYVYNGHSYIGYGPLDPTNFTAADFPKAYQILFIDSCVSYNYYEKDFFKLKSGGSANLDMVTNGLETWTTGSGAALGKFLATLTNGKQSNWLDLLKSAEIPYAYSYGGDALRVVDGELDNQYRPSKTVVTVQ
jgi:hypothetical protein